MSFTLNTKAITASGGSGSTLGVTVPGSVAIGDLVVIACGHGSAGIAIPSTVDNGVATLTLGTTNFFIDAQCTFAWTIASAQAGALTYTVTFPSAVTDRWIAVYVYTPTGAVTKDQEIATAVGISTALDSGNLVNTGTDELVFGAGASPAGDMNTSLIGGAAATDSQFFGEGGLWVKAVAGTVNASATASSNAWVCNAISFIITGGISKPGSLLTMFR